MQICNFAASHQRLFPYVYIVPSVFSMHTDFGRISTLNINNITHAPPPPLFFCRLKSQSVSRLGLAHLSVE